MVNALAEYREKGFILKRGLFSLEEVSEAKSIAVANHEDKESGVHVWSLEKMPEGALSMITHPLMVETLKELAGDDVEFLSVKPVYKSSEMSYGSPWHQDWPYWKGSVNKISAWIALDDANTGNGCLRTIPGSHLQEVTHEKEDGNFGNRVSESQIDESKVIDLEMKAGDTLFFSDLLLHASYPNTSGKDRWSLIPTYRSTAQQDIGVTTGELWSQTLRI